MTHIDRRGFLRRTGAVVVASGLPWSKVAGQTLRQGKTVSGRKINIACVGCGGKGRSDIAGVAEENIVALCDVSHGSGRDAFQAFPKAKRYKDYRTMLREMDEQIDAVTVSTPDHMHFPVAMMAVSMGKHVFVQKPLTHTIWEARTLAEAARQHNVVTQMGIQGHCGEGIRLLKEWLDDGAIGPVREVHYWTDRPIWPQGMERPEGEKTPPASLDWNLWLGVAPERPYNDGYCPFAWRGWWDFGCGALGDIGCHAMDAAFYGLDLGSPVSVEAVCSGYSQETAPKSSTVTYQFPARGDKPPVKVVWRDGNLKPPRPKDLEEGRELPDGIGGQVIYGDKGAILVNDVYCSSLRLIPESAMRAYKRPEKTLPRSPGLMQEWTNAIKNEGPTPGANFDYAGPLTEMVLLGNLAVRTGKRIEWDGAAMRCTNVAEANRLVRTPYRVF